MPSACLGATRATSVAISDHHVFANLSHHRLGSWVSKHVTKALPIRQVCPDVVENLAFKQHVQRRCAVMRRLEEFAAPLAHAATTFVRLSSPEKVFTDRFALKAPDCNMSKTLLGARSRW